MNQRQMRQLAASNLKAKPNVLINEITEKKHDTPVKALSDDVEKVIEKKVTHSDKQATAQSSNLISDNPLIEKQAPQKEEIALEPVQAQSAQEPSQQPTKESRDSLSAQPSQAPQSSPSHQTPQPNKQSAPSFSKLIQFRIDQACLFTNQNPDILLSDDIQADYIRELVIFSIDYSPKYSPMLSLLLHCTSSHLEHLFQNIKTDTQKKQSIHIFRQLQSDLLPKSIE